MIADEGPASFNAENEPSRNLLVPGERRATTLIAALTVLWVFLVDGLPDWALVRAPLE